MKKSVFKLVKNSFIFVITNVFLFTGCSNFMAGGKLSTEINKAIDYVNSQDYELSISSQYGKISPSGTITKKVTDTVDISFNADSEYQFICWKAYSNSKKTTELSSDYISFDNTEDSETSFTLNRALEDGGKIYIVPVCYKRPKIVTATPVYDTAGVYRDRTIVVMFDKEMDESSIYWTEEEIKEILEDSFDDYNLLPAEGKIINEKEYYYGYVSKTDENDVTFKNIKITELSNQSNNLLRYFDAPEFDNGNKRTLRIKTKTKDEIGYVLGFSFTSRVADAPDAATEILVTIGKDFHEQSNGNNINLSGDYSWVYFTNYNTDVEGPVFTEDKLHITAASADQTAYDSSKSDLKTFCYNALTKRSVFQDYNIKSGKLWIDAEISDAGIGSSKMNIVINQIIDGESKARYYPLPETPSSKNVMLNTKVVGQNGNVSQILDISDLQEGFYELYLIGYDKNDRSTESQKFYFIYDVVGPKPSTFTLKSSTAMDIISVVKNPNSDVQYDYRTTFAGVEFTDDSTEMTIKNLGEDSRTHNIEIVDYDFHGNTTVTYQPITAVPSVGMIYYTDGYWSKDYREDKEPAGVIWKVDENDYIYKGVNYGNVRIVDLYRDNTARYVITDYWNSAWPNGWNDYVPYHMYGIAMYKDVTANSEALSHSEILSYLYNEKNKEEKWVNAGIEWYLPSVNELLERTGGLALVRGTLQNTYTTLREKNKADLNFNYIDETSSCTIFYNGGWYYYPTVYLQQDKWYNVPKGGDYYYYRTASIYMAQIKLK